MQQFYSYRDAAGVIHRSSSPICPPGMTPHRGPMQDGHSLRVSHVTMDSAQQVASREGLAAAARDHRRTVAFDVVGRSGFFDVGDVIGEGLAATPVETGELQDKAARALLQAKGATGFALTNAIAAIDAVAESYRAFAHRTDSVDKRAACRNAASTLDGAAAAHRHHAGLPVPASPKDEAAAYADMKTRIGARCA